MKIVAITGQMGSGKSQVIKILQKYNFATIKLDDIVKELYLPNNEGFLYVKKYFKEFISNNKVNTKLVIKKMMRDQIFFEQYEKSILALSLIKLKEKLKTIHPVVFVEIAFFPNQHWRNLFDETWLILCSDVIRKKRIVSRENCSLNEAKKLMNLFFKESNLQDYSIIKNDKDLIQLEKMALRKIEQWKK